MNIEPITKEVEETFHLSIPKDRIDVVNRIIAKNPEIDRDLARDLVLSAALGMRVPNPKFNSPEGALEDIAPHLDELWYNIRRLTSKTLNFEPVDVILNQDRRTISLHIRWTHKGNASESTLFINFKKFETFPEFYQDMYDKLNKSLHTNMLPYRLVFLGYGKMARLACIPIASVRKLAEDQKVVYENLYLEAKDGTDEPETNCSLIPTLKELLEELPHISKAGDYEIDVAKDNTDQITAEINDIIQVHPDKPEIKVEVQTDTYAKKKPDALPAGSNVSERNAIEVTLTLEETYYFQLDDNFLLHIANYLNVPLAKTDSKKKFYTVQSDYHCENYAIVCCTEEEIKPFEEFGYLYDKPEPWARNKKALEG